MERTLRQLAAVGLFTSTALLAGGADLASTAGEITSRNPLHETGSERDHLTGDWGGARTRLTDRGVHFQFGYIGEVFGNVAGGEKRGVVYEGLAEMALELDLEKLAQWHGGLLRVSGMSLHGRGPSRLAGDALTASNIDGHDSVRLYEWWAQQSLFHDTVSIRAGSLLADDEFAGTTGGGRLLNSAFGWPAFISGSVLNTGPAFYVSALGVRLRIDPGQGWYVQGAVFDGDSFDSPGGDPGANPHGTHYQINSEQGELAMSEVGLNWHQSATNGALAGQVKLGAWFHTADFPDNASGSRIHEGNFGGYIAVEQKLWQESDESADQSVEVFARFGGSPEDRSTFAFVIDAGLSYAGPIPWRDQDTATIGFVHADFSDTRSGYKAFRNYEQALELTYELVLRPWCSVQPSVQWIHNPGGKHGPDDALLIGVRSTISF
ncbi:MAG TPA: carbohydrate porin [Methylomirabilota bacterium]|nr:carbohydrate porin [Methylomirabilota bacterium]